jgi:hypothetical protein
MTRDDGRSPTDVEIDREIESLTEVEPSVEYLTRIRTRIALEPPPAAVLPRWLLVAGGLVAAAIVAMVAMSNSLRMAPRSDAGQLATLHRPPEPSTLAAAPTVQGRPVLQVAASRSPASIVRRDAGHRQTARQQPARAEVLIEQDEAGALRRFIARASSGEVQMARATVETYPGFEPEPIRDIVVPAIAIEPLVSAGPEEGARQ